MYRDEAEGGLRVLSYGGDSTDRSSVGYVRRIGLACDSYAVIIGDSSAYFSRPRGYSG
jgi:hypothetical protein